MKRLLLLGGGHSHLEVIRRFASAPLHDTRITLVTPEERMLYSGMLPGLIAGHYRDADCHIDLVSLCEAAGIAFHRAAALHVDAHAQRVRCNDGQVLDYDFLSVNVGGTYDSTSIEGAREHGVSVRPLTRFVEVWSAIEKSMLTVRAPLRLAVIGAGAGGVELALAIHHKLSRGGSSPALLLLGDTPTVLPDHPDPVRKRLERILRKRGIRIDVGNRVVEIGAGRVRREHGSTLEVDHAILATAVAAPAWLSGSRLQTDTRGFLVVNRHLQSVSHPEVYAAGDIASIENRGVRKSGVYAVRQGPYLAINLHRAIAGEPLLPYAPQPYALALISAGNRHAVASWRNFALEGRWIWRWKDHIDRKFVARYRSAT